MFLFCMKNPLKMVGVILFLVGLILTLNSLPGITGNVIGGGISNDLGSIFGLALVVIGGIVFLSQAKEKN